MRETLLEKALEDAAQSAAEVATAEGAMETAMKAVSMSDQALSDETDKETSELRPFKIGILWPIIRAAGLVPWAISFVILFVLASILVAVFEPNVEGFLNATWLMFQVVTTIGLGDYTCASAIGRIAAIVLSVYSVFFLALITGAVVSYCQERMRAHRNASVAQFIDQLEHLPELSPEQLTDLSEKVKRLR